MSARRAHLGDFLKPGRTPWSDAYANSPHSTFESCLVCGKRTSPATRIVVCLSDGGDALVTPANYEHEGRTNPGFMGCWSVGPECGRAIPAEFRFDPEVMG
jgi:hypothetical protein